MSKVSRDLVVTIFACHEIHLLRDQVVTNNVKLDDSSFPCHDISSSQKGGYVGTVLNSIAIAYRVGAISIPGWKHAYSVIP